jgi:polyferredoxin
MLFSLGERARLDLGVESDRNPRYVMLSDGTVRNGYTVKLRNMETRPRSVNVTITGLLGAVLWSETGSRDTAGGAVRIDLAPDATTRLRMFVAAPGDGPARSDFVIKAVPTDGEPGSKTARAADAQVRFERPEQP